MNSQELPTLESSVSGSSVCEPLLLDTDIGTDVDDALALLFALKCPRLSLEGVTTVYACADLRAKIAKKLLVAAGRGDIPVHSGISQSLTPGTPLLGTGREGEGILNKEEFSVPLESLEIGNSAVDFLIETIMSQPRYYNVATIGALSNLAAALQKEPKLEQAIKHLYIMGGAIRFPAPLYNLRKEDIGRDTELEYNLFCDREAARQVFVSSVPKTIFPLDVTASTPINREEFNFLAQGGRAEKYVKAMVDVWFDYRDKQFGKHVSLTCMHDPLTLAAIIYPEIAHYEEIPLSVNGQGLICYDKKVPLLRVAGEVNAPLFKKIFLDTISS